MPGRPERSETPWRRWVLHGLRVAMFAAILGLVHYRYLRTQRAAAIAASDFRPGLADVRRVFPGAAAVQPDEAGIRWTVSGADGGALGTVVQTSPAGDRRIGFSGPTNLLVGIRSDGRIEGVTVLASGDTREHVDRVVHGGMLESYRGLSPAEVGRLPPIDAVSGATLTSLAIQEAMALRLSEWAVSDSGEPGAGPAGSPPSLRFPQPLALATLPAAAREPNSPPDRATRLESDPVHPSMASLRDASGKQVGRLLRTSPWCDQLIGYQGPTETLVIFDDREQVCGIFVSASFDNPPYVEAAGDDEYFRHVLDGLSLEELAQLDLEEAEVEGVSGATMTSMAMAEGAVAAAAGYLEARAERTRREAAGRASGKAPTSSLRGRFSLTPAQLGSLGVILGGCLIALTRLRGNRWLRRALQVAVVGWLGLLAGDLVSQAMLVGWARSGVPWETAPTLVVLTASALTLPVLAGRNVYCSHLCPHGVVQQWTKGISRRRVGLPRWLLRGLAVVPLGLLTWCVIVATAPLEFSLVSIEPFDAWVFRVAGWATVTVACVGLVASLVTPMAYCRFGCPTGALLNFLRRHARSDRWATRDWCALMLVGLAALLALR